MKFFIQDFPLLGIYVHFPYCQGKCLYCDFNSYPLKSQKDISQWVKMLLKEIDEKIMLLASRGVDTIYFGGGTPSLLPPSLLEKILKKLFSIFKIKKDIEISLEANPGTVNREKLKAFKGLGVNRLSLGVQTFNDNYLKKLGRLYQAEDIYQSYYLARQLGFKNINLDLLFGLPGQKKEEFFDDLKKACQLKPEHLSPYNLTLKKENPLYQELPPEEDQAWMYKTLISFLKKKGYFHYEISNFSKLGFQCQHNLKYWRSHPYLSFGPGAHSLIKTDKNYFGKRIINNSNILAYEKGDFIQEIRALSKEESIKEYILTNFRLTKQGIDLKEFKSIYKKSLDHLFKKEINELKKLKLLDFGKNILRLSSMGILYADEVICHFM